MNYTNLVTSRKSAHAASSKLSKRRNHKNSLFGRMWTNLHMPSCSNSYISQSQCGENSLVLESKVARKAYQIVVDTGAYCEDYFS